MSWRSALPRNVELNARIAQCRAPGDVEVLQRQTHPYYTALWIPPKKGSAANLSTKSSQEAIPPGKIKSLLESKSG